MLSGYISDFFVSHRNKILIFGLYAQDFYESVQKQNLKMFSLQDTSGTKMEKFLVCSSTFSFQVCWGHEQWDWKWMKEKKQYQCIPLIY